MELISLLMIANIVVHVGPFLGLFLRSTNMLKFMLITDVIIKPFTDGDVECWRFTFNKEDCPDWAMCGLRFNYKYLENFKKYLIDFSKNYKQYLEWQNLKDLKEDF